MNMENVSKPSQEQIYDSYIFANDRYKEYLSLNCILQFSQKAVSRVQQLDDQVPALQTLS